MWIGPADSRSGLHADDDPLNLLFQMHGNKTLWLYPPHLTRCCLHPSSRFDNGATVSSVNPFPQVLAAAATAGVADAVELGDDALAALELAYPRYSEAHRQRMRVDLVPGDVLFVPAGWMHAAVASSASVSLSGRVQTPCELLASWWQVLHILRHNWGARVGGGGSRCLEYAQDGGCAVQQVSGDSTY